MDPVGKQGKIAGNKYRVSFQKCLDQKVGDLDGGFNKKSGTRSSGGDTKDGYTKYQGSVKGKTKHTYGVDGRGDAD